MKTLYVYSIIFLLRLVISPVLLGNRDAPVLFNAGDIYMNAHLSRFGKYSNTEKLLEADKDLLNNRIIYRIMVEEDAGSRERSKRNAYFFVIIGSFRGGPANTRLEIIGWIVQGGEKNWENRIVMEGRAAAQAWSDLARYEYFSLGRMEEDGRIPKTSGTSHWIYGKRDATAAYANKFPEVVWRCVEDSMPAQAFVRALCDLAKCPPLKFSAE
jgi:hypothetical protein